MGSTIRINLRKKVRITVRTALIILERSMFRPFERKIAPKATVAVMTSPEESKLSCPMKNKGPNKTTPTKAYINMEYDVDK